MKITSLIFYGVLLRYIASIASTIITSTSNEVLFKPLGQLIPELSWGTIRIHVNMSDIFIDTNYLCKASRLMDNEWAKMKRKYGSGFSGIPPKQLNSRSAYFTESLTKDIAKLCEENSKLVQEIIEVYHLKKCSPLIACIIIPNLSKIFNSLSFV